MEISRNGERVGTILARLAVGLGDVWFTLVKTSNVEYFSVSQSRLGSSFPSPPSPVMGTIGSPLALVRRLRLLASRVLAWSAEHPNVLIVLITTTGECDLYTPTSKVILTDTTVII